MPKSSRWLEPGQDWSVPLSERTELLLQPVDQEAFNG
jgi:hypothetical protein